MAAFVRADHREHPVGALQRALGLGAPPDSSLVRSRFARRQAAGRIVLIWAVTYACLRLSTPFANAVEQAVLFSVSWALLAARARRAFSTMTFAIGSFAVSAGASLGAVAVVSVADDWLPQLDVDNHALAVVCVATFAAAGIWDQLIRRTPHPPQRVLVVGGGRGTTDLLDALAHECRQDIEVIGIVDDGLDPALAARVETTGRLDMLDDLIRGLSPDLVVIAVQRGRPEVFAQLLGVADAGLPVRRAARDLRVRVRPAAGRGAHPRLVHERPPRVQPAVEPLAKRAFDLVVARLRDPRRAAARPVDRAPGQAHARAAPLSPEAARASTAATSRCSSSGRCGPTRRRRQAPLGRRRRLADHSAAAG